MIMSRARSVFENGEMKIFAVHDGKLVAVPTRMRPYFFVRKFDADKVQRFSEVVNVEETDLKYRDERKREYKVVKVECARSGDVGRVREALKKIGVEAYEADILYHRRCLIDNAFRVDYSSAICYIDIELDDKYGFPSESGKYQIVSVAAYDQSGRGEWFYIGDYDSEREMLNAFMSWLQENSKTILCGWNVNFDYEHLVKRTEVLRLKNTWLQMSIPFDLMEKYKEAVKGLEAYSLEEVSEYEGYKRKERNKAIHEMRREELEEYNMYDAELCYLIDKDYGFSELQAEVAAEVNLTMDDLSPVKIADALVIRRLREIGYVAKNTGTVNDKDKSYTGAMVKTPVPGVHRDVIYLDFEALYPNIIINEQIDIDGFDGEVMPHIMKRLVEKRRELKQKFKETGEKKYDVKQKAMKPIINSMYGVFGNKYWRYKNYKKAEMITSGGRKQALRLEKIINDLFGMEVIYIDTDSAFVKVTGVGNVEAFAKVLEKEVNDLLKPYAVKVEDVFDAIIFLKGAKEEGVKKRYIGITKSGEWIWRGVEKRRGDWCRLAKEVQEMVARMVLVERRSKEEILVHLARIKKEMFEGKHDDKLIIAKGFRNLEEYKANQPHIRALRKALERGYKPVEGKIRFVWVAGGDVEPITTDEDLERLRGKLNYRYYWENQVYPPVKRILDSVSGIMQKRLM